MDSNVPLYFTANTQDLAFHIALDAPKHPHHPPFVRDPPRDRLPASSDVDAWGLGIDSRLALVKEDLDIDFYTNLYAGTPKQRPMTRKRRSLQQILVPNFLQGSSLSTPPSPEAPTSPASSVGSKRFSRLRAHSSATVSGRWGLQQLAELPPLLTPASTVVSPSSSPPPSFLLDDDPFANLTSGPSVSRNATPVPAPPPPPSEEIPTPETPRSPLMPTVQEIPSQSIPRANSAVDIGEKVKKQPAPRAFAGQRLAPVAAHQRPAFRTRPSLPSLSTLSQMNVVLTKKVRKGRVGAGLPFEPWDNPTCELPPRVLQDISGTSTQSLPPGTQPLLPSQLVGLAANNPASATEAPQPSHTPNDPSSSATAASPIDEVSTTPNALSQHIPLQDSEPSQLPNDETYLFPSSSTPSDSGHGHDLVDNYYSRSSSDLGHEEEEENARHRASDDDAPFSVYNQYSRYTTDFDTDTTTTASTSCDELSPPPSSRVSSLDLSLPPTLSRSVSPVSVSSQRSVENGANRDSTYTRDGHSTARSSSEYSDSLRSQLDSDNQCPSLVSSESYFASSTSTLPPFMSPITPAASVQPSASQLSPTLSASSIGSSGYFLPPFSSIYAQESTALGLVANWRDQFGYGTGPGLYLSDLELSDSSSLAIPEEEVQPKYPPIDAQDSDVVHAPLTTTTTAISSNSSFESSETASSSSSSALMSPPSLPTHIPSPTSPSQYEDGLGFPRFVTNSKSFVASPIEDVDGIAWPSSADTVRPLIRREGPGSEGRAASGQQTHGAVNAIAVENAERNVPEEVVDGEKGAANGKGPAAFSGGGAVMESNTTMMVRSRSRLSLSEMEAAGQAHAEPRGEHLTHLYQQPFLDRDYHHQHDHLQHQDYHQRHDYSISTSASSSSQNLLSSSSGSSRTQSVFSIDSEDFGGMVGYQAPRTSAVSYADERWSRGSRAVDGSGWEASPGSAGGGGSYRGRAQSNQDYNGASTSSSGWYGQHASGRLGFGRGGGGDDDDDDGRDDRRRQRRPHLGPEACTAVSTSASDREDDEDSADDYGPPAASAPATSPSWNAATWNRYTNNSQLSSPSAQATRFPISSTATSSDDDDVPLAQRIPTALTAQKSIRRQVREERQVRKLERAATTASKTTRASGSRAENEGRDREWEAFSRERHTTLRPAGAGGPAVSSAMPMTSSQEAAMHAIMGESQQQSAPASAPVTKGRQRTMTMPSKAPAHNPFSPEDLAKRLQNVQLTTEQAPAPTSAQQSPQPFGNYCVGGARGSFETPERSPGSVPTRGRSMKDYGRNDPYGNSPSSPLNTVLRSRSVHNADRDRESQRRMLDELPPPPPYRAAPLSPAMPVDGAEQRTALSRQFSRSQSRAKEDVSGSASQAHSPQAKKRSLSISRGSATSPHVHAFDHGEHVPPVPPLPLSMEEEGAHQQQHHVLRKLLRPGTSGGRTSGRTSLDGERSGRSPVTPLAALPGNGQVVQQRVFIGDMQRFNMVEITNSTTAGEVIDMIDAQGSLKGLVGSGGWMVYEVAQDFGMERPIRSFELLSDVQASWNKDKMVNLFVLKMTPLSVPLSRSAIPSSSPLHHGYVEWESKRGKWSKRWMQLREHSLWLSKREGKDEIFLCSLSNFDAYSVTRSHRAPKPFAFAVKSTDSLSFFENAADYLHNFSCNEKEGRIWMEKILVARSYVLHQERQVLFNPKAPGGNASGGLTRSGTRKSTTQRLPAAPLVSVPPPYSVANQLPQSGNVFEPGSLLSKQP